MWCYRLSLDVVALLRAEEGLRVLACESVEALAVKFGLRASAGVFCVWFRWRGGRGRCVRRARGVGVARAATLQRVWFLCVCARAEAQRCEILAQRPSSGVWLSNAGAARVSGTLCDAVGAVLAVAGVWPSGAEAP